VVEDSVLMSNVTVEAGATVRYAILDDNVTVGAGAAVGADEGKGTAEGITVIGADQSVPAGGAGPVGAMIG
jgi:glucose-1-phosphate adenylyltransferase